MVSLWHRGAARATIRPMKVLIVEDDLELSGALSQVLAPLGFQLVCCADGLEALALARRHPFDALVLDLTLPGLDGLQLLQRLRDGGASVPVLVVTARGAVEDRVNGLNIGADDYLAKPFDVSELEARIRALIRRHHGGEELRCGSLRFDRDGGICYSGLRPLEMSPRETALIKALLSRRGQAVTREALFEAVFGAGSDTSSDAIDVLVHRLRKRIAGCAVELMTLRGVGYLLIDEALSGRDED
jgi:DNA-binding response OmpR family regulator